MVFLRNKPVITPQFNELRAEYEHKAGPEQLTDILNFQKQLSNRLVTAVQSS